MDTPKYEESINPILQALREGGGSLTQVEMVDAVERLMDLPEAVMERRHVRYSMMREFDYCLGTGVSQESGVSYTECTWGVGVDAQRQSM